MSIDFSTLDKLKAKLDSFRPLDKNTIKNIHENLILNFTYHSNAIEGNTLTLKETKVALEGITIGGKTLREHFEAINHKEAILFMETLAQSNKLLNEYDICSLHSIVLKNIDKENAGKYRNINVSISGAIHKPPLFTLVNDKMKDFINWYKQEYKNLHPIELSAKIHIEFVKIHPFIDGNGRTSRLLMNLELIKAGFPPAIIKIEDRLEYYNALDIAHTKNDNKLFMELMSKIVEESFEPYFFALGC